MSAAGQRTKYVGRAEEQAKVMGLLRRAAGGHGGLATVAGEAGVGKTRFVLEIAAEAEGSGFLAVVGRTRESDAPTPYAPFVDLITRAIRSDGAEWFRRELGDEAPDFARLVPELRTRFPDIPQPIELPPEHERRYLFDSFWRVLVRTTKTVPVLIVTDDLHLADAASLHLLEYVAERIADIPAFLIATHRAEGVSADHPMAKTLRTISSRLSARVALDRLSTDDVAEMLASLAGGPPPPPVVAVINADTDGNPFFVEEVVKHLKEEGRLFGEDGTWRTDISMGDLEVPGSIRLVIDRRLERLTPGTRSLLETAAVAGRSMTVALFGELAQGRVEPVSARAEAETAGLITADKPGSIAFAHELVRQTLQSGLPDERRRKEHARVADAIERAYVDPTEEMAADLAHHLLAAGPAVDAARAVAALETAGDRSLVTTAFEEARTYFASALELVPRAGSAERARVLYRLGIALSGVSRWDEAMTAWDEALAIAESLGDSELAGHVCASVILQLGWVGRWMDIVRFVARGLAAVGQRSSHRAMLLAIQGTILAGAGDHTTGAAMNDTAVALAEEIGDQRLLGHCMLAKAGRLLLGMRVAESLEAGERAMSLLRSSGALYDVAGSIGLTMISASMSGRFDRARALEEDLGPLVERVGHPGGLFGLHTQRGFRALADGPDLRGFEDEARAADELSRRVNLTASMGVGPVQLGLNEMFRGRLPDAVNAFRRGIELEPPGALSGAAAGFLLLALAYAGRRDELLDEWKRLRPTIPVPGRPAGIGAWTTALAAIEALALVEERSAAASLGPVVGAALEQGTLHREFDLRSLHTIAGIAARCAERWSDAERSFDVAISAADSVPLHLEAADARRYYAEMLLARGKRADRDRARELANEALKVYERAGMPMHVGLARELAARG